MTAAADPRIAATVALVPMADGLAAVAQPAPPGVTARLTWSLMRRALTRRPVTIPVAGAPGSFAMIAAPEALPGFERLASGNGWRNEVNAAGLLIPFARFRPVQHAARIRGPVLVQLGERDGMVPLPAIEKVSARAPNGELVRLPHRQLRMLLARAHRARRRRPAQVPSPTPAYPKDAPHAGPRQRSRHPPNEPPFGRRAHTIKGMTTSLPPGP
jgi:hypothetical protein